MALSTKQLYPFRTACSGNLRNSIYIKCQGEKDDPGYLLAADRDGQPVILPVQQFYQPVEMWVDPAECCGQLTEAGFEALYAQYLLWRCPLAEARPLICLCFTSEGHFIVLRGVQDGQILVADPASYRRSEKLWDLSIITERGQQAGGRGRPVLDHWVMRSS